MKAEEKQVEKEYLKLDAPILEKISLLIQGKKEIDKEELKDVEKYLKA